MSNQVAVVTGAGSGIGAAIAHELSSRGFTVVVSDINLKSAQKVVSELKGAAAEQLDVTNPAASSELVNKVVKDYGRIDVWVSNAGISKMQKFVDVSPEDLKHSFEVNTYGIFYCGQAVARKMIELGTKGKIINTASMAAKQLAPYGIRVNCVCPGFVATPMQDRELSWEAQLRGTDPETIKKLWINDTPLGRLETPEDVAKVVAFLAGSDADFITGEAISVNGGAYMD